MLFVQKMSEKIKRTAPLLKKAIALKYEMGKDQAPIVVAKGDGFIAEKIIALARTHDIHCQENPELVQILSKVELETQIPYEAFATVAQIIVYLYKIQGKLKQ
ncbi:MAG: EscU/YscU/HrcU family type III secretion system export apparatus switch protein [Alphaproteobacteria bacterium]|nr:EscU/YscU/HrcU family type III secretion system export apparatus switch protein [Alphaproteobacteria bacterium]